MTRARTPGSDRRRVALRRAATMALAAVLVLLAGAGAWAHFNLNVNIRIIHVEHRPDGLMVRFRLPMAYLVADKLGPEQADGLPRPAPYTTNALVDGQLMHSLDVAALRADPLGLGALVAEGHRFTVDGVALPPRVMRLRAHPALRQSPFATLAEAERSFDGPVWDPTPDLATGINNDTAYVGDTVVDAEILYAHDGPVSAYTITGLLNPGLPGQDETANLIVDNGAGQPLVHRLRGLLAEPVEIERKMSGAILTFVKEGIIHILEGTDHVLFVVCLVLGATALGSLLWRITGFTLGHSITLAMGFFGYVPQGPWFVPLVETGIALSIIFAAVLALAPPRAGGRSAVWRGDRPILVITTAIGLLHGLGFSFVLREILGLDAPHVWPSLVAFNLGVEVGQVMIALTTWIVLALVARWATTRMGLARWALALPCIGLAGLWVGERSVQVLAALGG